MLKANLDYFAPASLQEAVDVLGHYGERAKVMAGGTDLLIALQKEEINCNTLVDIGRIDEIKEIKKHGSYLVVGSAVPFSGIIRNPLVMESVPLLVQASLEVGSPQIRNRGTIGGNLGTASPAGDLLTPLIALEAEIVVVGPAGRRKTPVGSFLGGGIREKLKPNEIISEVWIPLPGSGEARCAFIKLGRRKALAISRLNLALYLEMQGEKITKARMAVGAAGPLPFRVAGAEQYLVKSCVNSAEIMTQVSRAVADSLGDRPSAQYKAIAVKGLVLEALSKCGLV